MSYKNAEYRKRHEIVADILFQIVCNCGEDGLITGIGKTAIMYGNNLSYKLLVKYLDLLMNRGLIELDTGRYNITNKGCDYLVSFDKISNEIQHKSEELQPLKLREKKFIKRYLG